MSKSRRCQTAKVLRRIQDLVEGRRKSADILEAFVRELKRLPEPRTMPLSLGLNNFHCRLPGGLQRRFDDITLHSRTDKDSRAGKRRQKRTLAEFHEDIDRTILEVGLDPKEIRRLQDEGPLPELHRYVMPLYRRLREKGYKRYPDLVA